MRTVQTSDVKVSASFLTLKDGKSSNYGFPVRVNLTFLSPEERQRVKEVITSTKRILMEEDTSIRFLGHDYYSSFKEDMSLQTPRTKEVLYSYLREDYTESIVDWLQPAQKI